MNKIVICTGLYENSDQNILAGHSLAKSLNLKPLLYHIDTISPQIEKEFHSSTVQTKYEQDSCWGKEIEATVLKKIESQLMRLELNKEDFDFENFEGSVNQGIEHLNSHEDIEFLIVGSSTHTNFSRLFLGTFAEKSFFHINKDVLVVKKQMKKINHITYLAPYSTINKKDLDTVSRLAKETTAKVSLECVLPIEFVGLNLEAFSDEPTPREMLLEEVSQYHRNAEEQLKNASEILNKNGVECSYSLKMILNKAPGSHLEKMVEKEKTDLVIIKPQHHLFEHLSVGSTTLDLLRHLSCNLYLLSSSD